MSSQNAPGSATRNGTKAIRMTPANAAPALRSASFGAPSVKSMTAKNGIATSANCLSVTATARLAAAQTNRRRARSAKARTSASRGSASAFPNHAARMSSGFAASAAPTASRQWNAPGKSSAAGSNANVASKTRTR